MLPDIPVALLGGIAKDGAEIGLLLWFGWTLLGRLNGCWGDRLGDWKVIADALKQNGVVIAEMITSNDTRTRAAEATARAQDLMAQSLATLSKEVSELRAELQRRQS